MTAVLFDGGFLTAVIGSTLTLLGTWIPQPTRLGDPK